MIPLGKGLRQYDAKAVSIATSVDTGRETLVQQHLKEEVDVNTIVRRFGLTNDLPSWRGDGLYGDFTGITDYESAVEKIRSVDTRFMALPVELRDRFKNDPAELVRFADSVSEEEFNRIVNPAPSAPVAPEAPVVDPPA